MAESTTSVPAVSPLRRNALWSTLQALLRIVFTTWLRYRGYGIENLPKSGGGLILSNHQSFLDPLLIGLPLQRPVSFLARDSLFRVPVIGWILRKTHVMPIDRSRGSAAGVREMLHRLEEGYLVGIFPEGTRSEDGSVGELKPGFAAVVRRTSVPVYPVGIAGANRALGRKSLFLHPERVCVVFGPPMQLEELAALSGRGQEAALLAAVRARIVACQQEAEAHLARTADLPVH